jgi:plasmid stabilization system protein ParE
MALPLVFRPGVGRDLAVARMWYERQLRGLGEQFLACVETTFDTIEQFPELSAPVRGDVRRAMVPRFPYAVFYRVEPQRLTVLAVVHTARDPKLWPR